MKRSTKTLLIVMSIIIALPALAFTALVLLFSVGMDNYGPEVSTWDVEPDAVIADIEEHTGFDIDTCEVILGKSYHPALSQIYISVYGARFKDRNMLKQIVSDSRWKIVEDQETMDELYDIFRIYSPVPMEMLKESSLMNGIYYAKCDIPYKFGGTHFVCGVYYCDTDILYMMTAY